MLRTTLTKSIRTFATTSRVMAAGDVGAPRPTGSSHGDAFREREKAQEDYAIRQREKEKLAELKKRLADSNAHIKKLEEDIDDFTKGQGGEQK